MYSVPSNWYLTCLETSLRVDLHFSKSINNENNAATTIQILRLVIHFGETRDTKLFRYQIGLKLASVMILLVIKHCKCTYSDSNSVEVPPLFLSTPFV